MYTTVQPQISSGERGKQFLVTRFVVVDLLASSQITPVCSWQGTPAFIGLQQVLPKQSRVGPQVSQKQQATQPRTCTPIYRLISPNSRTRLIITPSPYTPLVPPLKSAPKCHPGCPDFFKAALSPLKHFRPSLLMCLPGIRLHKLAGPVSLAM